MPEWDNPKYIHLFTPSIWQSSYKNIQQILAMDEWNDPRYKHLFTPSIWANKYYQIASKLSISYFQMPEYEHLLTPSIFLITEENIKNNIILFQELGLTNFITTTNIRVSAVDQRELIKYMINHNMPLIVWGRLHPILRSLTNNKLKEYGITWQEIRQQESNTATEKRKSLSI